MGLIMDAIIEAYNKRVNDKPQWETTKRTYTTPRITTYNMIEEWIKAPHLLIAGATGSGKSVLINRIIHDMLGNFPSQNQFVLIDPKRVELSPYKNLPHTFAYASETEEIIDTLEVVIDYMESRYKKMQEQGIRKFNGSDFYIIIDEYADLVVASKRKVEPLILRIAQLGRAAKIHLIIATQRPTRDIITGSIKVNIDHRIALHVPTTQDSRNIIGQNGAETLPPFGEAIYYSPSKMYICDIPMVSDEELNRVIKHWEAQVPKKESKPVPAWKKFLGLD